MIEYFGFFIILDIFVSSDISLLYVYGEIEDYLIFLVSNHHHLRLFRLLSLIMDQVHKHV